MTVLRVKLDYGSDGLEVELPASRTRVVEPAYPPAAPDPERILREALRAPLGSKPLRARTRDVASVVISVCDGTRAQPREAMIRAVLDEMSHIPPERVTILVATGTHRANTPEELEQMLGPEIAGSCRVINHDARDEQTLLHLGATSTGVPIWISREWMEAEFRITTGFIEPHFFAGFSGGPKMVTPGLAGLATTLVLHDAAHIGHPAARWGTIDGNPIQDDIRAIVRRVGVDFAFDVTLTGQKELSAAFAGELFEEHAAGCKVSKREAMRALDAPFDMVLTTNSGFPLDQNLYQSIKGMSAAANVVKDGGIILAAAECRDGIPNHGKFAELLSRRASPEALLQMVCEPGFVEPDQWQVQVQSMIQAKARVAMYSDGLDDATLRRAHLEKCSDIEAFVHEGLEEMGAEATLGVLPHGPQTIAYVETG